MDLSTDSLFSSPLPIISNTFATLLYGFNFFLQRTTHLTTYAPAILSVHGRLEPRQGHPRPHAGLFRPPPGEPRDPDRLQLPLSAMKLGRRILVHCFYAADVIAWVFDDCRLQNGPPLELRMADMTLNSGESCHNSTAKSATEKSARAKDSISAARSSAQKALDCYTFVVSLSTKGMHLNFLPLPTPPTFNSNQMLCGKCLRVKTRLGALFLYPTPPPPPLHPHHRTCRDLQPLPLSRLHRLPRLSKHDQHLQQL